MRDDETQQGFTHNSKQENALIFLTQRKSRGAEDAEFFLSAAQKKSSLEEAALPPLLG